MNPRSSVLFRPLPDLISSEEMAESTVESAANEAEHASDRELEPENVNGAGSTENPTPDETVEPDVSINSVIDDENARSENLTEPESLLTESVTVFEEAEVVRSEIVEEEESQTVTMRELLTELAEDQAAEKSKIQQSQGDDIVSRRLPALFCF